MLRLTLAQMRRSVGRLTAAGVAIAIGTAFVAATLLAAGAMTRTAYDAATTAFADADLVVADGAVTDRTLEVLRSVPGVRSVHGSTELGLDAAGPDGSTYLPVTAHAEDPALEPADLREGRFPEADDEIALPEGAAELLGATTGDSVTITATLVAVDAEGVETTDTRRDRMEVVGVLDTPPAAFLATGGVALATPDRVAAWDDLFAGRGEGDGPPAVERSYSYALVAVAPGVSAVEVRDTARDALDGSVQVRTTDEAARLLTAQVTGDTRVLTAVVLGFAAVALLVAGLVIANTFGVLVAQRTRTLALLRCVGADRSQLRRSVVLEALVLGGLASAAGLLLGVVVTQTALLVLRDAATDIPVPDRIALTPAVVLAPLAIGVVVTVLASLAPARAATRVAPVAALRPADAPSLDARPGRVRAWAAVVLTVVGLGLLGLGVVVAQQVDLMLGLPVGVLGGALSFVGTVLGAVFWVPVVVGGLGRLLAARGGPPARLAAANAVRNPRRTAATSAALFIGVTLVAMMSTGAASARTSLTESLEREFPVDLSVGTFAGEDGYDALPSGFEEEVRRTDGVADLVRLRGAGVSVTTGSGADLGPMEIRGVDPAAAAEVVHDPGVVAGLTDATVVVPSDAVGWTGLRDGDEVTLQPASPSAEGEAVVLRAVVTALPGSALLVTPGTLEQVAPDAPVSRLWVELEGLDAASEALQDVTAVAADSGTTMETVGAAVERAFFQQVVDTLLAVVVALLGVAVVIALVGVTNTLSLSVLERRRESATLRAVGLSRRQLRGTLAVEGMLIAGVGALVGTLLGVVYGWAGAQTLLGGYGPVRLETPWRDLGLVLVVSLAAGLLASVVPAHGAARTSPVAALAVE